MAEGIICITPQKHLWIWANQRRCTLDTLGNQVGIDFSVFAVPDPSETSRSNGFYGLLMLAYALNLTRANRLDCAREVLKEISPLKKSQASHLERLALERRQNMNGQIARYQGYFEEALEFLRIERVPDLENATIGFNRANQYIAVLCELGKVDIAEAYVRQQLSFMHEAEFGLQNTSRERCLQLSLAEVLLKKNSFGAASDIYLKIKEAIEQDERTAVRGIASLRIHVGLARISHCQKQWPNALGLWKAALVASRQLGPREDSIDMVIRYSLSHVNFMLGRKQEYVDDLREAGRIFQREGRQHFITGLGSGWLEYIWQELKLKP